MVKSELQLTLNVVSDVFKVSTPELLSKSRERLIVDARKTYCAISTRLFRNKYTLREIGAFIRKDHATVLYCDREANNLCETDKDFRRLFEEALKLVKEQGLVVGVMDFNHVAQL